MDDAIILFDDPLTAAEVIEHIRAAVDDYGAGYVDCGDGVGAGDGLGCRYRYDDGRRCLVGEVVWRARGMQIPADAGDITGLVDDGIVPAERCAALILAAAQDAQDSGETWGAVLTEATSVDTELACPGDHHVEVPA